MMNKQKTNRVWILDLNHSIPQYLLAGADSYLANTDPFYLHKILNEKEMQILKRLYEKFNKIYIDSSYKDEYFLTIPQAKVFRECIIECAHQTTDAEIAKFASRSSDYVLNCIRDAEI